MFYAWLIVIIVLSAIECLTVSLTTVWYVASAFVALILSFITDNIVVQFGTFVILGTILLATTRTYLVKLTDKKKVPTNLDRIVGTNGIVTVEINIDQPGEVKVDGKRWTAFSDNKIEVGKTVKVLSINSVKIKVEEVK
jgi:membrane protein implicated in regulation of membrane protease activity